MKIEQERNYDNRKFMTPVVLTCKIFPIFFLTFCNHSVFYLAE
ncbi:Uncharacterised protein [Legionella jordanis]|nr:Uncharacterised protein [Legionella jordanis]